jgi:nucleotide-binding universal stress UspA family protein
VAEKVRGLSNVFAVIDPTRLIQPALIKGEWICQGNNAELTAYCCIYNEDATSAADQQRELDLTREWLERIVVRPRSEGLNVSIQLEWNQDWRSAIPAAAAAAQADLVIKTASKHTAIRRQLMKTSDWTLLKETTTPVLLVSGTEAWKNRVLLAAVKQKPEDPVHEELNQRIVDIAHTVAENTGFELYAAVAITGDNLFFDRQKFADACRLPRDRVLSGAGAAHKAIANVADEINADIVLIGNPTGSDTAGSLIDQVNRDVLVLPQAVG